MNHGQLLIKKRTLPEWLTIYIFVLPFLLSFFLEFLKLPGLIKYTVDFAWIALFAFMFIGKRIFINKKITLPVILVGIWLLYVFIAYLFNFQSVFYFLWGIRNNLRFYVAFIAFAMFLDESDVTSCFKFLDAMFWVNAVVSFYQFFVLGYSQDFLGGIFGVGTGCNAGSAILFSVVVTKSLLMYLNGQERTVLCFLKIGISLVLAAMAEIKFFFLLFVIILIMSMLLTKFSWKKIVAVLVISLLMMLAGSVFAAVFGSAEELSFQRILELVASSSYATGEDLGRMTAIPAISDIFLTDLPGKLFGLGLGNCDTSAFAICNTPFFQTYESLHYSWFSSAFLYLETGYVGLILNLLFFALCFILAFRQRRSHDTNRFFCNMAMIFAIVCIILTFYNSSLRKEIGYIAYFVLALPFIPKKTSDIQIGI